MVTYMHRLPGVHARSQNVVAVLCFAEFVPQMLVSTFQCISAFVETGQIRLHVPAQVGEEQTAGQWRRCV